MNRTNFALCAALSLLLACGGSSGSSGNTTDVVTGTGDGASDSGETPSDGGEGDASDGDAPTGDSPDGESNEFVTKTSTTAGSAHGVNPSKIKPTKTEAAMKFFVIDKRKNEPIEGIVISMQAPDGKKYYTEETDAVGYGEVLVPVGQTYDIVYLSLGKKDVSAKVTVKDEPRQNIKLTLRYKPRKPQPDLVPLPPKPGEPEPVDPPEPPTPVFRLDGVTFDTGSADLLPESFPRLDSVVEYMTYKKSARIEVSGHTDNVGNARKNKKLSEKRAQAVKDYLVGKGIDGGRIEALGFGSEKPVASNDSDEGRSKNRRIEAREL